MTKDEWLAEGERLFGKDNKKWKFVCPLCGNIQSAEDFLAIGVDPDGKVHYSCIGRWTDSDGTIFNGKSPCNYTCGGFFDLSEVKVGDTPVFDFYRGEVRTPTKGEPYE